MQQTNSTSLGSTKWHPAKKLSDSHFKVILIDQEYIKMGYIKITLIQHSNNTLLGSNKWHPAKEPLDSHFKVILIY